MEDIKILDLIKCDYHQLEDYTIVLAKPAKGVLFITKQSQYFITGDIRARGKDNGKYPYKYLEMIEHLFGPEDNTIEVCSNDMSLREAQITTVDINPDTRPSIVDDGQVLSKVKSDTFNRWRCDPPYNEETAKNMYGTKLPNTYRLLGAGARVCKSKSLMFLLLGPQNYQICPAGIKRIGWIPISIIPNNELRALHIYYKE